MFLRFERKNSNENSERLSQVVLKMWLFFVSLCVRKIWK